MGHLAAWTPDRIILDNYPILVHQTRDPLANSTPALLLPVICWMGTTIVNVKNMQDCTTSQAPSVHLPRAQASPTMLLQLIAFCPYSQAVLLSQAVPQDAQNVFIASRNKVALGLAQLHQLVLSTQNRSVAMNQKAVLGILRSPKHQQQTLWIFQKAT